MILDIYRKAYDARYKPCEHAAAHLAGLQAVAEAVCSAGAVLDSLRALSEAASEDWDTNEATPYILGPPIDGDIDRFKVIARGPHGYAKNDDDFRKWQANRMFAVAAVKHVRTLLASHPGGQSAGSGAATKIPADREAVIALAIHLAREGDTSLIEKIKAELSAPADAGQELGISQAARDVLAERRRQVEAEGWTPEHDDAHSHCEMAVAAACYATAASPVGIEREWAYPDTPKAWPWHSSWWKPGFYRRNLVKAAALLIAEIERWDRAAS